MAAKLKIPAGNVLTIDIGGTNIKACVMTSKGKLLTEFKKTPTPPNPTPENVLKAIKSLTKALNDFEKIAIGFPGYVKNGVVQTAPNLALNKWVNINLA
ncbi:N-acetylmannosamine kinase [compost metagenome]